MPIAEARRLVTNGDNIPTSRLKYWVPYACRPTYWDLAALEAVAEAGGQSTCQGKSQTDRCLYCRTDTLRKVVFTGMSVTSTLMAAMRRNIFGDAEATRDKERDHKNHAKGAALVDTKVKSTKLDAEFIVMGQLMPERAALNRSEIAQVRRRQIRDLADTLSPSAFVIHVGLHELCAAYGPGYPGKHSLAASRQELMETYSDFGDELKALRLSDKSLFRSLLGSFPDTVQSGPWRWQGFADCGATFELEGGATRGVTKGGNPCPAVSAPTANAIFSGNDAVEAWSTSGVRVVDAFSPLHASPTSDRATKDGMHPHQDSDEALAINQLIMNTLCTS
jgi:hypothetical protein